jgi:2-amino-4-hydroxy-6-hydroxymethyldihydropteridine diphosphokinase
MPRCAIGLGGNLGSVAATFRQAIDQLANSACRIQAVSRFFRTPAVGGDAGTEYLNAAMVIDTDLAAPSLLMRLQAIETQLGRVRSVHWGPRTVDLDLLLYGDALIDSSGLTVPHPGCWYRRFVLDPLAEIASEVVHPAKGISLGNLRARLLPRPLPVGLAGGTPAQRGELIGRLASEFSEARFFEWETGGQAEPELPALLFWLERIAQATTVMNRASRAAFLELPRLPRFAVPATARSAEEFIRDAVQSAMDLPVPVSSE